MNYESINPVNLKVVICRDGDYIEIPLKELLELAERMSKEPKGLYIEKYSGEREYYPEFTNANDAVADFEKKNPGVGFREWGRCRLPSN